MKLSVLAPVVTFGLLTVSSVTALPVDASVVEYLHFKPSSGARVPGDPSKVYEVEIDDQIDVSWDLAGFIADLARHESGAAPSPIAAEIDHLRHAVDLFVETQARFVKFKSDSIAMLANSSLTQSRLREAAARSGYAQTGLEALGEIDTLRGVDETLIKQLQTQILRDDYSGMATVLEKRLHELGNDLARIVADKSRVEVYMRASLLAAGGRKVPVHLEGYDEMKVGEPVPFPRFQFSLDQRASQEVAAAEALQPIARDALSGKLKERIESSVQDAHRAVQQLVSSLESGTLEKNLDEMAAELRAANDPNLQSLADRFENAREIVRRLSLSTWPATTDLAEIASTVRALVDDLRSLIEGAPTQLAKLRGDVENAVKLHAGLVRQETIDAFKASVASFLDKEQDIRAVLDQLKTVAASLGLIGDVADAADAVAAKARQVAPGVSLDTHVDLQTVGERHPGDVLALTVEVVSTDPNGEKHTSSGRQSFRLEVYGPWVEPRGALLFVNPSGKVSGNQAFEPAPGLAFQLRYGFRDQLFINRVLSPGIGVSFSLLDFDDQDTFELGVAGNVSFLMDLLWVGYGRDLQAERDFYYVGINPLAVVDLFRRGGLPPALGTGSSR